jgi:Short-chain dehydrogenases of various substrate specificities
MSGKIALVTGASSGMGEATAVRLKKSGYTVYAGARRMDRMEHLKAVGIIPIKLDVTDDESMIGTVDTIVKGSGSLDVLVNNAGYGSYGALEDVPISEAKRQFEVNVFGLARLTQLVLPQMRKNRYGKIVNISSIGGKNYEPFGAWYHSTKFAVEGLSDCLRMEVRNFGIDVIVVEPGGIKTEWSQIAGENLIKISGNGAYGELATKYGNSFIHTTMGSDPDVIAKLIEKAITVKRPKARYVGGMLAKPTVFLRKILSDRMFDWLTGQLTNQIVKRG